MTDWRGYGFFSGGASPSPTDSSNQGECLVYHQFQRNCISSNRRFVYHQHKVLYIINFEFQISNFGEGSLSPWVAKRRKANWVSLPMNTLGFVKVSPIPENEISPVFDMHYKRSNFRVAHHFTGDFCHTLSRFLLQVGKYSVFVFSFFF